MTPDDPPQAVSPRLRRTLHVFLLVFALAGLAHVEAWPFTGFRLFSELRTSTRDGWELVTVDADGAEHVLDLHDLPVASRYTYKVLDDFDDMSAGERDEICAAWAGPRRASGQVVAAVRAYAVTFRVKPGGGLTRRDLAYECGRAPCRRSSASTAGSSSRGPQGASARCVCCSPA